MMCKNRRAPRLRRMGQRILHMPRAAFLGLCVCCAALLFCALTSGRPDAPWACAVYFLSALTLAAACVRAARLARVWYGRLRETPLWRFVFADADDPQAVRQASLRRGFAANALFCVYKAAMGIALDSAWLASVAAYYFFLAAGRFVLLRAPRRFDSPQKTARLCGALLFLLTLALSAAAYYAAVRRSAPHYPGHLIYAAALYAFCSFSAAVAGFVRARGADTIGYAAAALRAASAIVSMFFLQSAMLASFGDGGAWQTRMLAISGAVCGAAIAALSARLMRMKRTV